MSKCIIFNKTRGQFFNGFTPMCRPSFSFTQMVTLSVEESVTVLKDIKGNFDDELEVLFIALKNLQGNLFTVQ